MTIRIADHEWLSAPGDAPANARWEGRIDPAGVTTVAQIGFWPWGADAVQAAVAQVRLLDADGLLDSTALSDLSGEAVALELVELDGTYADAVPVARFVADRLVNNDDGRKTLLLRDAHDALDKIINDRTFAEAVAGLSGQRMPMSIGQVYNAPVLLTGSDGSVGWLGDAPQLVDLVRDRGDLMETGTWSMDTHQQQILLESPPLGPVTADLRSVGGGSLELCLREVMRRCGIAAWSSADAAAMTADTGYHDIGLYDAQARTGRSALVSILSTFGAWYWQDASGVLRLTRIVDPATLDVALELAAADLDGDVTYTTDTAPALTTRMAYRLNARPLRDSELVTDLVDVPPALRAQLGAPQEGIATADGAGSLPSEYRHALDADPYPSLFAYAADAQAEINRVVNLYQTVRRFWEVPVSGLQAQVAIPGQCCRLIYPRHGLGAGRKLLIRRVERSVSTGKFKLTLWG